MNSLWFDSLRQFSAEADPLRARSSIWLIVAAEASRQIFLLSHFFQTMNDFFPSTPPSRENSSKFVWFHSRTFYRSALLTWTLTHWASLSLSLKINWFRSWLDEEISFMAWLLLNLVWIRDETLYRKFGFPWNLKKFKVGLCPSSFQAVFGWLLVWSWKIRKKLYSSDSTQNLNLPIFIVMKRFHRKFF